MFQGRDTETSAPSSTDRALCKSERVLHSGEKGLLSSNSAPNQFSAPLSCCVDSLPAAEAPGLCLQHPPAHCTHLPVPSCCQSSLRVATCSRSCAAELEIMRIRTPHFAIRILASLFIAWGTEDKEHSLESSLKKWRQYT